MDLIAIGQGFQAAKSMAELVKAMVGLREGAQILEKTVELNTKILAVQTALANAQEEQTTLVKTIGTLEEEIARSKRWDTEKQNYELKQVSYLGASAYVIKPEVQGTGPLHCICAACYESGRKGVLQPTHTEHARHRYWQCPFCKSNVIVEPDFIMRERTKNAATQS